ncbi:hypothetical protein KI688_011640 [Linnemannia hyalina]|uniref:Uncharacterized protein n=1 Tax=Linnemannia hyalina TaxID=64524 RepID=A0A9P8BUA4_9FUNG|nr:hypothetical protein KI688_011640 [Linnemannia hyalina]
MLPTKRSSPFVRTRSFQDRIAKDRTDTDGPPFAKRPFTRTMSSPFQVVTTSLKGTKNPFEKLAVAPPKSASNSLSADYAALHIDEDQTDDLQDESMDPNKTLQMFSFSQNSVATTTATKEIFSESDDDDGVNDTDQLQDNQSTSTTDTPLKHEVNPPSLKRPRLQEALEMSLLTVSMLTPIAPEVSNVKKKSGSVYKTTAALPVDWTLKSSISITSPDSLTWCDHILPMDEIDALQHFISSQKAFSNPQSEQGLDHSPRIRVLSATYHWIYPTNTPSVHQAQNVSKLLKNAINMSSNINYEQLETLGGKVAVHHFSSKHDLDHLEDQDGDETLTPSSSTPFQLPQKKDLSSTLLFRGQVDVHGLFSYLLNMKTSYEDGFLYQSPSLIAGVPFLHAALKRAQPTLRSALTNISSLFMAMMNLQVSKCKVVSRSVQGTGKMQKEYRIEIHGTILPNSVKDLYQTLATQQQPLGYSCISTSDARSHGLNLRPLLSETADTDTEVSARHAEALASAKSLDQFRYDHTLQQYVWLS